MTCPKPLAGKHKRDQDAQAQGVLAGETPLGLAAGASNLEAVKLLLKIGAKAAHPESPKPQPLHRAGATGVPSPCVTFLYQVTLSERSHLTAVPMNDGSAL